MATEHIGEFISALRKAKGMTQRELAEYLNVSDKAVSRWERGETAPDLTLIPVIAELFQVTTDELLRGARKAGATSLEEPAKIPEKRIQILLRRGIHQFCSRSLISFALVFVGMMMLLIGVFGLDQPVIGIGLTGCFLVASFICECVFLVHALSAVEDETLMGMAVERYKHTVIQWFSRVVYANVLLLFCTLPIFARYFFGTMLNGDRYFGSLGRWLDGLPLSLLLAGLVCVVISLVIWTIALKKLHFGEDYVKAQRTNGKKRLLALCTALLVGSLVLVGQGFWEREINRTYYEGGKTFATFEEFKQYAETPNQTRIYDEQAGEWRSDREYEEPRVLYDAQGNAYRYMERNQEIYSIRFDEETMTSFEVTTSEDQLRYNKMIEMSRTVTILLMLAGCFASLAAYFLRRTPYPWEKKRKMTREKK